MRENERERERAEGSTGRKKVAATLLIEISGWLLVAMQTSGRFKGIRIPQVQVRSDWRRTRSRSFLIGGE